jgi:hypothetical protein
MNAEQINQTKTTSGIAFGLKVLGLLSGGPITGKTDGGSLTRARTSTAVDIYDESLEARTGGT